MRSRGFSIVELLVACMLVVFGMLVFFSVFSTSTKHSTQTRNSTVAHFMATNMLEEFEAHTYGAAAPPSWTVNADPHAELWIQGKPHQMKFEKRLDYANGSFVGESDENNDLVTLTISWREGVGGPESRGGQNKELKVQVPVWR